MGGRSLHLWSPSGLLLILILFLQHQQVYAEQGILHVFGGGSVHSTLDYCMLYNPSWTSLPSTLENATSYKMENLTTRQLCSASDVPPRGIKDKAVVVVLGNCSFIETARIAQNNSARVLLIASKTGLITPAGNRSTFKDVTIPIANVKYRDIMEMQQILGNNINATLYSPTLPMFDYSMLVIFLIAVFTVALGGYWSGVSEIEDLRSAMSCGNRDSRKKEENASLSPLSVVVFLVICCVMLLLLYFFYKWLVYVIIAVFCIASAVSLFNCLAALIRKISFGQCRISCCNRIIEVRLIFLAAFCISMSVVWVVFRNEDRWIWILQDILGIAFCLNFIKTLRMTNFKSCVLLLVLFLLYDVFFVFITPLITKNGESIMIEVAAGPLESGEKLPVVIRVPRLDFSALTLCGMPFSLLGFGDIILPGLVIAYCRRFAVWTSSSYIYYAACTVAYAVGMGVTFMALALMKEGQPALLYLVPCTLITSSVVAWSRKEMKKFWNGGNYEIMEPLDNEVNVDNAVMAHEPSGAQ
ncbi:signal peptide peptidase-like 2A isoform X2 [Microcaecilia unicolor]|uniref:Signal peptide peptidase-like 2A isoform X2 n=1 Tax=Microcaecilia unicolor TaxID=1415580 RepID=A0A6P7X5N8_9AMPH|nr:signal peptide peptidase-like 2A isoform X2 [Microcaecilia unicolor]